MKMNKHALKPGWKIWRFDQMATNVNVRIDNPSESGMEHYVGLEHLDADSLKIRRWGKPDDVEATKLMFKKGDIIFGRRRAYQRKLGVAEFDGICSAHAMVLRAKPEVVLPEFLPFFMQSDLFMQRAVEISVGSLSPTINWRTMAVQEFALPPIEEQKYLSNLLLKIEDCLSSYDVALGKTECLIKSLSKDQFDKNDATNNVKIVDHLSIVSGQVNPTDNNLSKLPLIAPNHIEGHTGRILEVISASEQGAISGKFLFKKDAVLYSKIRPNLVKAAIAPFDGLCSGDMFVLMPKTSLRNRYLLEILLSERFTQFALASVTGTAIPRINKSQFESFECSLPSIEDQDAYLARATEIREVRESLTQRIGSLRNLKLAVFSELWG